MATEIFDILTYDHEIVEAVDITTIDPDWQDLMILTTPARDAGLYEAKFSLQFNMNTTTRSFMYEFSMDGGASWGPTYYKEAKDRTDIDVIEVFNLIDHTGGEFDVRVRVTREASAACHVLKAIAVLQRVG